MKRYVLLGLMSLAAAVPAAAQYRQPSARPDAAYRAELPRQLLDQLDRRVDYDLRRGIIRLDDARALRTELGRLRRLEQQYGNYGVSTRERTTLLRRIDRLRGDVFTAERRRYARNGFIPRSPYAEPFAEQGVPRHDVDNHVNRDLGRYDRTFDQSTHAPSRYDYDGNGTVNMNDLRGPPPPLHEEGD